MKTIFALILIILGNDKQPFSEATRALGNKRYNLTRKDYEKGRIVVALVPIKQDMDALIEVVKKCPLLESAKKSHGVMKTNLKGGKIMARESTMKPEYKILACITLNKELVLTGSSLGLLAESGGIFQGNGSRYCKSDESGCCSFEK